MEAIVEKEAKVLVPNKEHKNFTATGQIIEPGTVIEGEFKSIKGLRRGEPFSYRVFITKNGEIIYSNNVKQMKATEVTLGADASQTPTKVNMLPAETFKTSRMVAALAGTVGGYYMAKRRGCVGKKCIQWAVIGGLAGYGSVWLFDKTTKITISPSR